MDTEHPDVEVPVKRRDLVEVYRQLELLVVSLDRIGSASHDADEEEIASVTYRFIVEWDVFSRLARARRILDPYFSGILGSDSTDALEREFQDTEFWSVSNRLPSSWQPTADDDTDE